MKKFYLQLKERTVNLTLNKFLLISIIIHVLIFTLFSYSPIATKAVVSTPDVTMLNMDLKNIDDSKIEIKKNKQADKMAASKTSSDRNKSTLYLPIYEVTVLPKFKVRIKPEYPAAAKKAGIEGFVVLEIDIDDTGKVVRVKVIKKSGFGFDEAAVDAIKKSVFIPAFKDGKPVPVRVRLPIKFELE